MTKTLFSVREVSEMIQSGKILVVTGEEKLLQQLPKGKWIGGTIPYFMTEEKGGVCEKDLLFVNDFTKYAKNVNTATYNEANLKNIAKDGFENGFNFIIIPATQPVHMKFAIEGSNFEKLYLNPLVGFVAGVDLNEIGKVTPKVFNGADATMHEKEAVVMHVELEKGKTGKLSIINIFNQDEDSSSITFPVSGFSAKECMVNGQSLLLADYIAINEIDTKLPLVADYMGAQINICIESIDPETKYVNFLAPVFEGTVYKHAESLGNYKQTFNDSIPKHLTNESIVYSCNCILNYVHGGLEGEKIALNGSMTFGEIAYKLLNQTFVYLTIE